jgi:hypothetical protein
MNYTQMTALYVGTYQVVSLAMLNQDGGMITFTECESANLILSSFSITHLAYH